MRVMWGQPRKHDVGDLILNSEEIYGSKGMEEQENKAEREEVEAAEEAEEAGKALTNDDDDRDETPAVSPTLIRHKELEELVRRTRANPADADHRSSNHQCKKRFFQDTLTKHPPLKRPKVASQVGVEPQTPGATTANTQMPVDCSF